MTQQEYLTSINQFSVLNSMSQELRLIYMNADPVTYATNLRMLELAEGDMKSSKKTYMVAAHEAVTTFEKEAKTAKRNLAKKAEVRVQSSEQNAAEQLIQDL